MLNVKRSAFHPWVIVAVFFVGGALTLTLSAQDSVDSILSDIKSEAPHGGQRGNVSADTSSGSGSVWLFPDSSLRKLSDEELSSMGKDQLWRARNEIFARRGYIFATDKGKTFSESLGPAYQPLSGEADQILESMNPVERYNVRLIESAEKKGRFSAARWIIAVEAIQSKSIAEAAARQLKAQGFQSDVLWIPDYSSLSGAQLWLVYVGSWDYGERDAVRAAVEKMKRLYPEAYAIKLDQSGRRETLDQ